MFEDFKLLYVCVQGKRCFDENEFLFTEEYKIEYKDKNLIIEKKKDNKFKDFFHKNIHSINVIVGKNGSGKTTLLDLIGYKIEDRRLNLDKNDTGWMALYKCKSENTFFIEGSNSKFLSQLEKQNGYDESMGRYSFFFDYDFENKKITQNNLLKLNKEIPYIFYLRRTSPNPSFYKNGIFNKESPLVSREYIKGGNLQDLYCLATKEMNFFKDVSNCASFLIIEFSIGKNDVFEEFKEEIEDYINSKNISENEKCCFIILQKVITDIYDILDEIDNKISSEYKAKVFEFFLDSKKNNDSIKNSDSIINEIGKIFHELCDKADGENENQVFKELIKYKKYILDVINKIKELSFENSQDELKIETNSFSFHFDLKNGCNESVESFLGTFDNSTETIFFSRFRKMFNISFNNKLSEGETQFINTYASIYNIISHIDDQQKSIIILLDEPDRNFHPMWISSFIKNLVDLVKFTSENKDIKYQFIITTHSPFMLSDLPKEYVTRIDIEEGTKKRIVTKATKTFASNYYQIIQDAFFLDDAVGQFAKEKINKQIEKINNIVQRPIEDRQDEIENEIQKMIELISIIDDPNLKILLKSHFYKKMSKYNRGKELELKKDELERELKKVKKELNKLKESGESNDKA